MQNRKISIFLYFLILASLANPVLACSMFKITKDGKTIVGNNEDAWRVSTKIGFRAAKEGKLGHAYFRYSDKKFAEGGVNSAGLCYDVFTVRPNSNSKHRSPITMVEEIMENCVTVHDVVAKLRPYDSYFYPTAMFLFVDRNGDYLVIEPDTLILGNEKKYVLANFCPSQTPDFSKVTFPRFKRGQAFLAQRDTANLETAQGMMDAMHVCRDGLGDGTLYTSIYDLEKGDIHVFFYHDFSKRVSFNIETELKKGDHEIELTELFPDNLEFQKFVNFKTPRTSKAVSVLLAVAIGIFSLSIAIFGLSIFWQLIRKKATWLDSLLRIGLAASAAVFVFYLMALLLLPEIFYFPAPYKAYQFPFLSFCAYLPLILLLTILPLIWKNWRILKEKSWSKFMQVTLTLNSLTYFLLLLYFGYCGFLLIV